MERLLRGAPAQTGKVLAGQRGLRYWALAACLWLTGSFSVVAAPFLTELELELVVEVNAVRTDPVGYAERVLVPLREHYDDIYIREPPWLENPATLYQTQEGVAALDEAIEALRKTQPMQPLTASIGLSKAARSHAEDQAANNTLGHFGTDGSDPFDRMARFGHWEGAAGENIYYGRSDRLLAQHVVFNLLVDDGLPERGHRENLLNPVFTHIGVAIGDHPYYEQMCVQTFSTHYNDGDGLSFAFYPPWQWKRKHV